MHSVRIVDVSELAAFERIPPCADRRFDHRTCDYWEDADRGSKMHRSAWLRADAPRSRSVPDPDENPFAPASTRREPAFNPFDPRSTAGAGAADPFAGDDPFGGTGPFGTPTENPFAPTARIERGATSGVPRKLALLDRGRGVFGSYAKVLLAEDEPVAYSQFGPLSAYPRAARLRDLYPQLPPAPLPAVVTCISTTAEARRRGWARRLVEAVCDDLTARGFSAIEAFPDLRGTEDETSAGRPGFWHAVGFVTAVDDERFPVMRRELV